MKKDGEMAINKSRCVMCGKPCTLIKQACDIDIPLCKECAEQADITDLAETVKGI